MKYLYDVFNKKITLFFLCVFAALVFVMGYSHYTDKIEAQHSKAKSEFQEVVQSVNQKDESNLPSKDIDLSSKPKVRPTDKGKLIYSPIGDSLSAGYFAKTSEDKFTTILSKGLENHLGYQVEEIGVASYGGVLTGGLKAIPDMNQNNPDLISIEFGTNDCNKENNVSIEKFERNLNKLIAGVTTEVGKSPYIVLVTTWNQGSKCEPFDKVIKNVGKDKNIAVADISDIWKNEKTKGPAGVDTYRGESDTFHPNNVGMKQIAERIFTVIEPQLKKGIN